jgi:Tfp pilus assembly protein PilO
MTEAQEKPDSGKWSIDWRLNVQTLIGVVVLLGGQAWYFSERFTALESTQRDQDKVITDFRVNGTPSVRVEISNMKARLDAGDARLERIERGLDRVGDKLDTLIGRKQ